MVLDLVVVDNKRKNLQENEGKRVSCDWLIFSRAKRAYYLAGARKRARNMYVALCRFSSFGC